MISREGRQAQASRKAAKCSEPTAIPAERLSAAARILSTAFNPARTRPTTLPSKARRHLTYTSGA